ncbi:hypothetical protein BO94DRAFT_495556 [Aspergillus sclerotioniger CBS 115572]|uniref:Uncharacterized protein n=1 Tax=Aspergillus sclerotioniger CBS 115572 TaxID=1450535 RepID=A0A317WGE6_9EURO|nr:hypothetical protein BO94DRAFT_495556 [Aspergillus sclerotioniger CBS 115572]PWY83250.1 hypothetical protein BO94DRAFT_495556 [Aspergillus sclerotioniger CBS 115572]
MHRSPLHLIVVVYRMAALNTPSNPAGNGQKISQKKSPIQEPLRYRTKSLYLLAFYVAILLIPWVMTCVMMVRPLDATSYTRQGFGLPASVLLNILASLDVITVLEKIQAVLAIPIVSGFLAQAAVVYAQRRSPDQKLSLQQLIALADRPWANVISWFRCLSSNNGTGSWLAVFGGLFVLLVAVTPAIQSLLVKFEVFTIATCGEMPVWSCNPANIATVVGLDPEPAALEYFPQSLAVQQVAKKTQLVSELDVQPYLWPEHWTSISDAEAIETGTFLWYDEAFPSEKYFVSALQNGTNTGVLREHALRLNSTSACVTVPASEFPQTCPGDRPFVTNLTAPDTLDIRICVPGVYGQTPWTLSRDRQDISEEMWIDVVPQLWEYDINQYNFTLRCTTNSTRGYFEISNYRNNDNPGPLLEKWPSQEELEKDFNDYLGVGGDFAIPSVINNDTDSNLFILGPAPADPFNIEELYAAGPLMTSALALFGNQSFFSVARNATNSSTARSALSSICLFDAIPFTRLDSEGFSTALDTCSELQWMLDNEDNDVFYLQLMYTVYTWIASFSENQTATTALNIATYFANEAVLTNTAAQGYTHNSREIYFDSGTVLIRPRWTLAGVITVSILIGLQVLGLCLIIAYCYSVPTWTGSFDAFAMLRMGAELQRVQHVRFAGIRDTDKRDLAALTRIDGLVGVVDNHEQREPEERHGAKENPPLVNQLVGESASTEIDFNESQTVYSGVSVDGDKSGEDRDERAKEEGLEPPFHLAVGAPGLITKDLVPGRKRRWNRTKVTKTEDGQV